MIPFPFIVYLKNRISLKFEYKREVASVDRTDNGYRITFNNGKSYKYGEDKVKYYPLISTREDVRIYEHGKLKKKYNAVDNYGRYLIFRDGEDCSYPIEKHEGMEICSIKTNSAHTETIVNYFKRILMEGNDVSFDIPSDDVNGKKSSQLNSDILLRALEGIDMLESRSALSNYIDGVNPIINPPENTFIYPFGCNESQKLAVETSLRNSMSVVEGPPGTGKTQTILNIIANLILHGKTVGVVSNNNSAVFNVREKLEKYGYGIVVASLGNNENKATFFESLDEQKVNPEFKVSRERLERAKVEVQDLDAILTTSFQYRNRLAVLKTELSDAEIDFAHIKVEQPLAPNTKAVLDRKFYRKWDSRRALKFKEFLSTIDLGKKLSFFNKARFLAQYGFLDFKRVGLYRKELSVYVNHKFYELHITYIKDEIRRFENWLASNNEEVNLRRFIEASKQVFNGILFERYNRLETISFNMDDYRKQFDAFIKRYPVILSSTLSLHTSIPKGYLFDFLIIDESSQVDIIKSAVCFSCSRNVIVVGDSMQLAHIVDRRSVAAVEKIQDEYRISPAYDYVKHNILDSMKTLYGDHLKSVLLKEHYRCHPFIIGFCNKKYYNNNLVIMTSRDNHPFRIIETTISGGRDKYNQRQIDETDVYIQKNYTDYTKIGVIAPYRIHADRLQNQLPEGIEADTIHKFQGREKSVIIFNTVKGKITPFIDNPNLINVAVSRAVKEFIIVKPELMELPHGTNIGDLIRYICYVTDPNESIVKSSVCSVFDLLYKEYNKVFNVLPSSEKNWNGSPAEMIVYKLVHENILLKKTEFLSIDIVREYRLRDLVRDLQIFSEDEIQFIHYNSRIDFLLYNKIDKSPVLAIEVDGVTFHDKELQRERDLKKNRILEKVGLPLLRLSTDGHNEEARIIEELKIAMGLNG